VIDLTLPGAHARTLRRVQRGGDPTCLQAHGRLSASSCGSRGLLQEIRKQKVPQRYAFVRVEHLAGMKLTGLCSFHHHTSMGKDVLSNVPRYPFRWKSRQAFPRQRGHRDWTISGAKCRNSTNCYAIFLAPAPLTGYHESRDLVIVLTSLVPKEGCFVSQVDHGTDIGLVPRSRPSFGPLDLTAPSPSILCMHCFPLVVGVNGQTLPSHQHDIPFLCTFGFILCWGFFFQSMAVSHNDMLSVTIEERSYISGSGYSKTSAPACYVPVQYFPLEGSCYAPGLGSSRFIRLDMWIAFEQELKRLHLFT